MKYTSEFSKTDTRHVQFLVLITSSLGFNIASSYSVVLVLFVNRVMSLLMM